MRRAAENAEQQILPANARQQAEQQHDRDRGNTAGRAHGGGHRPAGKQHKQGLEHRDGVAADRPQRKQGVHGDDIGKAQPDARRQHGQSGQQRLQEAECHGQREQKAHQSQSFYFAVTVLCCHLLLP